MQSKDIALIGGGAALALLIGLGAGGIAREPMLRAMAEHPMAAVPGTVELALNGPSELAPAAPAPLPVKWSAHDDASSATVETAPSADDARVAVDKTMPPVQSESDTAPPPAMPSPAREYRRPGGDVPDGGPPPPSAREYRRQMLAQDDESQPAYAPPPDYEWPAPRMAMRPPPPPPPYMYSSSDDGPDD